MKKNSLISLQAHYDLSIQAQFADLHHFRLAGMGDVILMCGASSSGKSSITHEFLKVASTFVEWNLDFDYSPMEARDLCVIEDFFVSAISASLRGHDVFMHWSHPDQFTEIMQQSDIRLPIKTILVFCSLESLVQRVDDRNQQAQQEAALLEFRDYMDPIMQYSRLYGATKSDEYLEILDRDLASQIHDIQFDKKVKSDFWCFVHRPSKEQIELDKVESRDNFFKNLGFGSQQTIKIGPKDQYDLILLNPNLSPSKAEQDEFEIINNATDLAIGLAGQLGYSDTYIDQFLTKECE